MDRSCFVKFRATSTAFSRTSRDALSKLSSSKSEILGADTLPALTRNKMPYCSDRKSMSRANGLTIRVKGRRVSPIDRFTRNTVG